MTLEIMMDSILNREVKQIKLHSFPTIFIREGNMINISYQIIGEDNQRIIGRSVQDGFVTKSSEIQSYENTETPQYSSRISSQFWKNVIRRSRVYLFINKYEEEQKIGWGLLKANAGAGGLKYLL